MKKTIISISLLVTALITGCSTVPQTPQNPPTVEIDGKLVTGKLSALCDDPDLCQFFELTLTNKTEETIEIDWNRSYYIKNGNPDGGLYFDGIVIAQRNNPRPPDIILPKSTFTRKLAPNNNFTLTVFPLAHWNVGYLEGTKNGVYLSLKSDSKTEAINYSIDFEKVFSKQ
jgi:hypothetical protein